MKYAFFPGCTMANRLQFAEKSVRMIVPEFGVELVDLAFTCCPEPNAVRSLSEDTWVTFAARNIALAEAENLDILTACAGCHESLTLAKHELDTKPERKEKANEILKGMGLEYKGTSSIIHVHQLLFDEIGVETISAKVVRPLPIKVVTHSGCHLLRPQKILQVDDAEVPVKLDMLCEALGMDPLEYMDKVMCCGAGVRKTDSDTSYAVLKEKMTSMVMVEPDAIVVFCPTCFITFESGQRITNRLFKTEFKLPVFYYTELLAIAMGLPDTDALLADHRVKIELPEFSDTKKEDSESIPT
ncbi:MAG: CoB--CoM heterodisulfide reductase subunit B [Candidatus Thorarchaeota archaeon]|nr:CoB--CoM heterodisulfide reductase subunit B [Candidatus Thorarchaeota archaeon]